MEVNRATVGLMNLIVFYIMTKVEREVGPPDLFFAKSASNAHALHCNQITMTSPQACIPTRG